MGFRSSTRAYVCFCSFPFSAFLGLSARNASTSLDCELYILVPTKNSCMFYITEFIFLPIIDTEALTIAIRQVFGPGV